MPKYTVVEMTPTEYFRVEADFRSEANRLGVNIATVTWESQSNSVVTVSSPSSVVGNKASALFTAVAAGCTLVKASGQTSGGAQNIEGYTEVHVEKAVAKC